MRLFVLKEAGRRVWSSSEGVYSNSREFGAVPGYRDGEVVVRVEVACQVFIRCKSFRELLPCLDKNDSYKTEELTPAFPSIGPSIQSKHESAVRLSHFSFRVQVRI